MALTRDKDRIRKVAALDTSKKIRLEPFLSADMRRMFKQMMGDFRRTYPELQETITPEKYLSDTAAILRKHYRKVVKAFAGDIDAERTRDVKARKNTVVTESVQKEMSGYIIKHSEKQARIIIDTTTSDLHDQIHKVVSDAVTQGKPLNHREIADLVTADYSKRINGRANIIAMTETQSLAEKTKDVEANQIQSLVLDPTSKKLMREWVAILDDDTREWHADADGQEVALDEPFIVNGEALSYPGDPSGSPENIINCRCSSVVIGE